MPHPHCYLHSGCKACVNGFIARTYDVVVFDDEPLESGGVTHLHERHSPKAGVTQLHKRRIACFTPSHYLNRCWLIGKWTMRNETSRNWNENTIFVQENEFETSSAKWWIFCFVFSMSNPHTNPRMISMVLCKTAVTPLITQWSYFSLALVDITTRKQIITNRVYISWGKLCVGVFVVGQPSDVSVQRRSRKDIILLFEIFIVHFRNSIWYTLDIL